MQPEYQDFLRGGGVEGGGSGRRRGRPLLPFSPSSLPLTPFPHVEKPDTQATDGEDGPVVSSGRSMGVEMMVTMRMILKCSSNFHRSPSLEEFRKESETLMR